MWLLFSILVTALPPPPVLVAVSSTGLDAAESKALHGQLASDLGGVGGKAVKVKPCADASCWEKALDKKKASAALKIEVLRAGPFAQVAVTMIARGTTPTKIERTVDVGELNKPGGVLDAAVMGLVKSRIEEDLKKAAAKQEDPAGASGTPASTGTPATTPNGDGGQSGGNGSTASGTDGQAGGNAGGNPAPTDAQQPSEGQPSGGGLTQPAPGQTSGVLGAVLLGSGVVGTALGVSALVAGGSTIGYTYIVLTDPNALATDKELAFTAGWAGIVGAGVGAGALVAGLALLAWGAFESIE